MEDENLYLTEEAREDYQRYLAITHAAMGDYMSGDDSDATGYVQTDKWCGFCHGIPYEPSMAGKTIPIEVCEKHKAELAAMPIDVEAETVRPSLTREPNNIRALNTHTHTSPEARIQTIIDARHALLTAINYGKALCPDERSQGVFDAAYDALYTLDILNPTK